MFALQASFDAGFVYVPSDGAMNRSATRDGATGTATVSTPPFDTPHVLIVDDDAVALELFRRFFSADGFDVSTAASGRAGLSLAAHGNIDVVVLDLCLPDMSGLAVLADLRHAGSGAPVVTISGFATLEEAAAAMKLGAIDVLSKPIDADELVAFTRSLVARAPATRGRDRAAPMAAPLEDASESPQDISPTNGSATTRDEQLFASAQLVIRSHVGDPELDLATVAKALGVSRWRLSRAFSTCSADFRSCVRAARMQWAGRRLRDGLARSVKEVAIDVGYRYASDFTRHFKAYWRMTPKALRERYQRDQRRTRSDE